ncbi:hypothetical protein AMK26_30835 [Streptomyces sp. CB03234]|uniref:hypothetical protein n=1 Tax=Streptomyces sp. (strain CB03234) TaxID=1703937 RepID=UPI000939B8FE|nr:hypothetical protein [Streptomyces sp. CB03234]OKJ95016.1 hypothetical protein AMK26_30835 [Streptomyces sp. CB03234]
MPRHPRVRLVAVCASIAGASVAVATPAVAGEQPPASVGAPVVTDLNSTGPLSTSPDSPGHQASPLPVGGSLLGGLPAGGLPAGLPVGG